MAHARKKKHGNPAEPFLSRYAPIPAAPAWLRILLPILVAVAAFVAFLPALDAGFVNWDDDKNIINNPYYRGLSGEHLKWMFTKTKMGHWQPLSWISLALDYKLHGEGHPGGYHLTNMLLHAAGAVAFYFLALRLLELAFQPPAEWGRRLRLGAAFAALFFAVHPLRVEAVAWVTERRDVLSGLFFIATINAYLISRTAPRFRIAWYVAAILLLILSVLSKAWGMTMPAILLVLDWYPLRRFGREKGADPLARRPGEAGANFKAQSRGRVSNERGLTPFLPAALIVLEKLPFAIIAVAVAVQAKAAQARQLETLKSLEEHGVADRLAQAFYGLAFYVYRTIAPFNLVPIYEIPDNMNPLAPRFVVSAAAVIAAAVLIVRYRRRWPAGVTLALCYVAIFSPVSGIAQSGPQLVKDSYTYLCCLSWAVLAGGLVVWAGRRWGAKAFAVAAAGGSVIVVSLSALTWRQTIHWRDSKSLWTHTLAVDPDCWNARNNLAILVKQEGDQLKKAGRQDEANARYRDAAEHYRRSLDIHPGNADALFNRGNCLKAMGDYEAAIASYLAAIEVGPEEGPAMEAAQLNLGNTYRQLGQLDKAAPHHAYVAARRNDVELYGFLAADAAALGRSGESKLYADLGRNPGNGDALTRLAVLLLERGECAAAKAQLHRVLRARPDDAPARDAWEQARTHCP